MEKSSFFNSVNGDRKYKAEDYASYFSSFIGNGVFPNPSTNLQILSNNNMTISLKSGKAWVNGYFYFNTDNLVLNIAVADGVLKRIDKVVLRLDYIKREIKCYVKKGNFASSPAAPTLQRDSDIYELGLADVLINNGATSITQANITDLRLDSTKCGIVTGTVDQIDATTLFAQYDAEFSEWFNTVKGSLSGDVAGNLQAQITTVDDKVDTLEQNVTTQLGEKANNTDNTRLTTAKDVTGAINELFQNANNGKTLISNVVGSPLLATDTFQQLYDKIQTLKNTMATNLTSKGQSSVGTEPLTNLIDKISSISTLYKLEAGDYLVNTANYLGEHNYTTYTKVGTRKYTCNFNGTVRVKITSQVSAATGYLKVYKNGVAVGQEFVLTNTSDMVFTQDLSINDGDYFEVYGRVSSGTRTISVSNVQFGISRGLVITT